MSRASMSGRKAAMTSKEVAKIMSPTRCTRSALTGESNAHRWTTASCTPRPILRSTPIGPACRDSRVSTPGPNEPTTRPTVAPSPNSVISAPPGLVDTSATASTRSRTTSGCCPAYDMTLMPPIECPTSTTGPVVQVASRTAARSRPSWATVQSSRAGCAGAAVPALVVGDDPETGVDQRAALEHPRLHRQGEPVDEHDGRGAPGEVAPAQAGRSPARRSRRGGRRRPRR